MALESDALHQSSLTQSRRIRGGILHKPDNLQCTLCLVAVELEAEVIVVQLGRWIGGRRGAEGEGDVFRAQGVEEDACPKGPVAVVEGFVDDVPGVAGAGEVADDVGDVGLDDGSEGLRGPCCCEDF